MEKSGKRYTELPWCQLQLQTHDNITPSSKHG